VDSQLDVSKGCPIVEIGRVVFEARVPILAHIPQEMLTHWGLGARRILRLAGGTVFIAVDCLLKASLGIAVLVGREGRTNGMMVGGGGRVVEWSALMVVLGAETGPGPALTVESAGECFLDRNLATHSPVFLLIILLALEAAVLDAAGAAGPLQPPLLLPAVAAVHPQLETLL